MATQRYSVRTGIEKVVKYFVIFLLPVLVNEFVVQYPQIAQLSVGALLVGLVNFLKVKVGLRIL